MRLNKQEYLVESMAPKSICTDMVPYSEIKRQTAPYNFDPFLDFDKFRILFVHPSPFNPFYCQSSDGKLRITEDY